MTAPLGEQQLAEIRADLDAVPAPPWRWIGMRGSGGPQLVTDHSGRQYLLRAKKPTDGRGDEVLDPQTDFPVYGDLEFRDQRAGERYAGMRPGDQLAVGRADYDPDSIVGVDNPVARWVERSAAHAAALLAEVERLRAADAAAGLVAEYRVPLADDDGRWLSVRREPNGDRWAVMAWTVRTRGAERSMAWVGGRWQVLPAYGENGVWEFGSADAALAEATRLAGAGDPR